MHGTRVGLRRRAQAGMAVVAVMSVGAVGAPAALAAVPTELFFSEYVEGSAPGNDALEIFNGTGQGVNLLANGYQVDIYLDGGAAPLSVSLNNGILSNNDVYVLTNPNAIAPIQGVADQTAGVVDFSGNDTIVLRRGGLILDVIGQIGTNPGLNGWGLDPTNTSDNTLRRLSSITAGDVISNDPFDPATQWAGFPVDTFSGLGAHTIDADPGGGASDVVSAQVTVAASAACLQLSTNSVTFGTLPLGASGQAATVVTITNCSAASETLLANGTNATGAGASWNLVDSTATCASGLGTNNYHLSVESPPQLPQTRLATTNKTLQSLAAAQAVGHTIRIDTACPGSSGAGVTMTMSINYLVTP